MNRRSENGRYKPVRYLQHYAFVYSDLHINRCRFLFLVFFL